MERKKDRITNLSNAFVSLVSDCSCSVFIDYEINRSSCTRECYESGDYCRCTTIDPHVKNVNIDELVACMPIKDAFMQYCFDRILRINKIWDTSAWECTATGGYYGEELGSISLYGDVKSNICSYLIALDQIKNHSKMIEYILIVEYGYLLDSCKDLEWEIKCIDRKNISIGQENYRKKVYKSDKEIYKNHKLPLCIVVEQNGKYRLIDGYHRLAASDDAIVKLIIGKK